MPTFPNASLLAKVLPKAAANAPRMVNFTGVPEGMAGNQYYGLGLGGIDDARQKLAAAAAGGDGLAQVHEPFGVGGYALSKLGDIMQENSAISAEKATRDTLAGIIGGIDPVKGPTMDQIQAAFQADPAYGTKLYEQLVKMQNAEHWVTDPNNPNLQRNTVTGETKGTGDKSQETKLSDISSAIGHIEQLPSYKNMAQAQPIWDAIQNAGDNAQGDLNIILGMAKLFDPGSVVRDKEGETVVQTAGLPTEIFSAWKYMTGQPGSRLDAYQPGLRDALLAEGYTRMKGYNDAWLRDQQQWREFAGRHSIDPRDLLLDSFPALAEYKAKTQQPDPNNPDPNNPPAPTVTIDEFPAPAGTPEGDVYRADDGSSWVAKGGKYHRQAPQQANPPRTVK